MTEYLDLILFILIGFSAQLIDGSLGMGFGIMANTALLAMGYPPVAASASIHTAGVFTTAVSGYSHYKLGNVEKKLFITLLLPAILGGVIGAVLLSHVDEKIIKPIIGFYLLCLGISIFIKSYKSIRKHQKFNKIFAIGAVAGVVTKLLSILKPHGIALEPKFIRGLGFLGGFTSSLGGGGWGPIVTSTLIKKGHDPRFSIGSANAAEFFVMIAASAVFFTTVDISQYTRIIVGLLIGGVIGAPLAAAICRYLPTAILMVFVGSLMVILSSITVYLSVIAFL